MNQFVLNKAAILERLGGDEEIFAVMADMYLQEVDNYNAQLSAALAAADPVLVRREAHTIKSLLATFADEEGNGLAFAIEQQAKTGDLTGLEGRIAELQERLRLLADALKAA